MLDPLHLPAPEAVLLNADCTLFEVDSVGLAAEQLWPGQGAALPDRWRRRPVRPAGPGLASEETTVCL